MCGRLLHFDHERRLAARDVVRCAHAREDSIDDSEFGLTRRDERPGLRHQRDERRLSQVRRLAAHVRAGQHHELAARAVERDVVGHERVRGVPLDDRMAAIDDGHGVAVVHVRLRVVPDRRNLREDASTSRVDSARAVAWISRAAPRDASAQRLEELHLALEDPLVGAEDLLLVLLERRRDEALAAGDRLLAVVVRQARCAGSPWTPRCSSRRPG